MALRRSDTTIATVSTPRTVMASLLLRAAPVHLVVPFHDLVVRDPVHVVADLDLVLLLPRVDDPTGRGVSLEFRHEELRLPPPGLEGGHHLRPVEDDVAVPGPELLGDLAAEVEEEVVHRREHELPADLRAPDAGQVVLEDPMKVPLPPGEEPLHEPALRLELPEERPNLGHRVLVQGARGEVLRGDGTVAPDDPPEEFLPGLGPGHLRVLDDAESAVRVPDHVASGKEGLEGRERRGGACLAEGQEPGAGDGSLLRDPSQEDTGILRETRILRGLDEA